MTELMQIKFSQKLIIFLLAGLVLSNVAMVGLYDRSVYVSGSPITLPIDEEWTRLASDGDEGSGCNLKAVYTQMQNGVLFFKVEVYRNWVTPNDIDVLVLLDVDQDPRTGAPDGILNSQQTSLGSEYAISIGKSVNKVLKWNSTLWDFDATGMPALAYVATLSYTEVVVGVQASAVEASDGRLDLAVVDRLSGWDWLPDSDYWGGSFSTAHLPFIQQVEEHQMVISIELPRVMEPGTSMYCCAVAINYGTASETGVNASITYEQNSNGQCSGGTYSATALPPGDFITISTPLASANPESNHKVTASVKTVAGETSTEDNNQTKFLAVTRKLAVISDNKELDVINPLLDSMRVPYDRYVNNSARLYTENLTLLQSYRAVIFDCNKRAITSNEFTALNSYLASGGDLLITGVDSNRYANDASNMCHVIRSSHLADASGSNFTVADGSSPIMNGTYGRFSAGYNVTGLDANIDQVVRGSENSTSIAYMSSGIPFSKILVTQELPGTVIYWNGNGVSDWINNTDCQAMFKNTIIWLMDTAPPMSVYRLDSIHSSDFIYDITVRDIYGIQEIYYTINGSTVKQVSVDGMPQITQEGINLIEYWAVDLAGNVQETQTTYAFLDKSAPTGSIMINNGSIATASTAATLNLTAYDPFFVVWYRLSGDGVWDTEAWILDVAFVKSRVDTTKNWTLSDGDGPKTVYYQLQDITLNVSETYSATIILDTTPPTGSIAINGGATYTTSINSNISLSMDDLSGAGYMRFSNDNSTWSDWETYATSTTWSLTEGDGEKTVYCQVKDMADNIANFTSSIILDTSSPVGTIQINSGATYTNNSAVNLTLSASDLNGVTYMRFSNDNASWSTWEPYSTTKNWTIQETDGTKTVYAQFQDNAGLTIGNTAAIILDTNAPTIDVSRSYALQSSYMLWADASLSSDANGVASYVWDFGDGTTGSGMGSAHFYGEHGSYPVTVTLTDYAGNSATEAFSAVFVRLDYSVDDSSSTPQPTATTTPTPTITPTVTPTPTPTGTTQPPLETESAPDTTWIILAIVATGVLVVIGGVVVYFKRQ